MQTGGEHNIRKFDGLTEKDLLRQTAAGDAQAFTLLFDQYWDPVYSATLLLSKSPELAEDIAQEVFTRIWERRSELKSIDRLEGYLFIMARNMIYGRLRRELVEEKYRQFLKDYFRNASPVNEFPAELKDLGQALEKAIGALPERQQQAFRLSRFEGLSHEAIAREMGISKTTVKNYIVSSIATLRQVLSENAGSLLVALWIDLFL